MADFHSRFLPNTGDMQSTRVKSNLWFISQESHHWGSDWKKLQGKASGVLIMYDTFTLGS